MGQYLEEALFLMQLIGIRVFAEEKKGAKRKREKAAAPKPALNIISNTNEQTISIPSTNPQPAELKTLCLPDPTLKIGAYVYAAMRSLEETGYSFTDDQIDKMCSSDWSKTVFHTRHPFMKRYIPGGDLKGADGRVRFKKEPYSFGGQQVLITKEWFESQRQFFIDWFSAFLTPNETSKVDADNTSDHISSLSIPSLLDSKLKVGTFVKTAMEQLSQSGFEFTDEEISILCADSSMKKVLGMQRNLPFFKEFDPNDEYGYLINGRPLFYAKPLTFGKHTVCLTSQIYEADRESFISWYKKLVRHG